jgi:hypothetical protein
MSDRNVHTRLTEEHARQALRQAVEDVHLRPGSWEAVPRRQRRQRRRRVLAVAVNLALVLAVAGALTPVVRDRLAADRPTATPSTKPLAPQAPVGPIRVLASGSYNGKTWQYVVYRTRRGYCEGWNYAGNPNAASRPMRAIHVRPFNGGSTCGDNPPAPRASFSLDTWSGVGHPVFISGTVGKNAVQVRIFLRHRGSPSVVTVKPVGQEAGLPYNFYAAVLAGTDNLVEPKTVISKAVAYDRGGRPIGQVLMR